jgi:LuxR family transcriptional regulator, maltose regulon positive regulatory protein
MSATATLTLVPPPEAVAPRLPPRAPDAVSRPRLVQPLIDHDDARVAALVAPAGFGKTAVLREWAASDPRPFCWLSLDERDGEPMRLLTRVTRALAAVRDRAEYGARFVLVLDDVHVLRSAAARGVLGGIAADLPPEATLAVASRTEPPLPMARLRAQRSLVELRADRLALSSDEVAAVLRAAGEAAGRERVTALMRLTEGWAAGLSLVRLPGAAAGDAPEVADYVHDEVLAALAPATAAFLRRTSVLDELSGPSCDALLQRTGSAATLATLAHEHALLVPLDRRGERYRHHRLLRDALRALLHRAEPDRERMLHARAARWHRHGGDRDAALEHALRAGDVRQAAAIAWRDAPGDLAHGRFDAVDRRLARFSGRQVAASAPLALTAAARSLAGGRGDVAEHWVASAASAAADGDVLAGAAVAALRAGLAHHGLEDARADARRAAALAPDDGPCRALACLVAGVAAHLVGDRTTAAAELAEGVRRSAVTAPALHALCLTQLAILAQERDDWEDAAGLLARAHAQVDRFGLAAGPASALVFAASAYVGAHRGRVAQARTDLQEAARLAAQLVDYTPWFEVELRVLMGRCALRLGDAAEAELRLDEAARVLRQLPEAMVLHEWLAQARAGLTAFGAAGDARHGSLTTAELRILGYLPTHLSFREIAQRTFVSGNTVKTQANAVYRKLDVSCRSDAVTRARALGLLDAD